MTALDDYAREVVEGRILVKSVTVYALCDSRINDQVLRVRYVGQTRWTLEKRLKKHWQTALAGERTHRAEWMRVVHAAGAKIEIIPLQVVPREKADDAEMRQIALGRMLGCDLTNTTIGGRLGMTGHTLSAESRAKMSAAAKGRRVSEATKAKMRAVMTGRFPREFYRDLNLGRTRSPETRAKMSAARRGSGNGMAKLTWPLVNELRARFLAGGITQAHLAREYGIPAPTICMVLQGKTWRA